MSGARDVARAVLRRVEQGDAYATLALSAALDRERLAPPDRGLATELVYGVLRHRTRLDRALAAHARYGLKPLSEPVRIALRVAAYQILFLRVPHHAAVDDAVEAVKQIAPTMAGFANAVLRRLADRGEPPPPPATDVVRVLEELSSIPRWLGQTIIDAVGKEHAIAAAEAMNRAAPVALRARVPRDDLARWLQEERPDAEIAPSPYLPEAVLLGGAGSIESLAAFEQGLCTVQDVAAQLVGRLVGARPGERILDACAGVGGKATHLATLSDGRAEIHAVDVSRRKLDLAEEAARRLRVDGIRFLEADLTVPDAPLADSYDRILLDAPCSGLGVLRRHPEGKWRRRPAEIRALAELQRALIDALIPRLAPGGIFVYSVCTFTRAEGDDQVDRLLASRPDLVPVAPDAQPGVDFAPFLDDRLRFRSWPHLHGADGFFAARLRRA